MEERAKATRICATCWYSGGTAGYSGMGKSRRLLVLCRRGHEQRREDDCCPKYLPESGGD